MIYFCLRIGPWMLHRGGLFRLRRIRFGSKNQYSRTDWVRVL